MSDAEAPPIPYEATLSISGPAGSYRIEISGPSSSVHEAGEAALHAIITEPFDPIAERLNVLARAIVEGLAAVMSAKAASVAYVPHAPPAETPPVPPPPVGGAEA